MRAIAIAVLLCAHVVAHADAPEPIVLASGDPLFRAALADALGPAGMSVVTVADAPPSVGDVAEASRAIADREHASSTVWLLEGAHGATLVAYDRGVDRVLVRSLPYVGPLSPAQAAEAARAARTMLRALRVTPDVDQPPPRAVDAAAVRARAAAAVVPASPLPARPARRVLAAELGAGVRLLGPASDAAPVATIAATWRPDQLGVALVVGLAPSAAITTPTFAGHILDDSLAIAARLPLAVAPRLRAIATAGPALHLVRLDGDLGAITRIDPALHVGLAAQLAVGAIEVGAAVSADWLLRRQTYDVGAQQLLAMPPVQVSIGLVALVRIL